MFKFNGITVDKFESYIKNESYVVYMGSLANAGNDTPIVLESLTRSQVDILNDYFNDTIQRELTGTTLEISNKVRSVIQLKLVM